MFKSSYQVRAGHASRHHDSRGYFFALTPALVIVAISPVTSLNRFVSFKFAVIGLAFVAGLVYWLNSRRARGVGLFTSALVLQVLTAISIVLAHPTNQIKQVFGTNARGVGLLSLILFSAIAFFASRGLSYILLSKFIKSIFLSGAAVSLYALVQYLNLDFIDWSNDKKWIFSTLGNPNHLSAFLAAHIFVSAFLLKGKESLSIRILASLFVFLDVSLIYLSQSTQGFLILIVGVIFLLLVYAFLRDRYGVVLFSTGGVLGLITLTIWGASGHGPFLSFFEKGTLLRRVELYDAAVNMASKKPLIGHGFNSYEWLFPVYRSPQSVERVGTNRLADSPHNQLLEYAVSGGVLLAISLLFLLVVTTLLAVAKLKQFFVSGNSGMLEIQFLLTLIWISTVVHNFVSSPSLAISYLSAFTSGLIVSGHRESNARVNSIKPKLWKASISIASIPLVLAVTVYPYVIETSLLSALKSRDTQRVIALANAFPPDEDKALLVAAYLSRAGGRGVAVEMLESKLIYFPKSIRIRSLLVRLTIDGERRGEILREIEELDPYRN